MESTLLVNEDAEISNGNKLDKTFKRLKAIEDISYTCSTLFTSDVALASYKVLKPFCELSGADYGLVFLLKNPTKQLFVEATYGLPEEYKEIRNKEKILTLDSEDVDDNWPSIRAILKKQIVVVKDLDQTSMGFSKLFRDTVKPHKIRSVAAVPIVINDKAVGVITKYFVKPHVLDEEELSFMKTTANIITSTIERNHLLETAKKSERELAQANEILKQVNQELDSFVYIASHDLREPLRTIESFTDIIGHKLQDRLASEENDYLERIIKATQRMRKLIEDLTHLSRASRDVKENELVNLNTLLTEVQFELTAFIQKKDAQIIVLDRLPNVIGSKGKISSIFKNLILNGIKFNRSLKPQIKISLAEDINFDPDKVCICIEDNGIGIEEEYHNKIFGLFQRLHTNEDFEGTGAGLAIVKKILEKYYCDIWLNSVPGKGSKFFFTLNRVNWVKAKSKR